ncbi:MAG: RNase J family beta-CASP ribonuclease [Clostridiales Family XIII bacterium]|jgi:ribonuclease J|nr:RNase J family beta-CASP ribonuclease [Clostridiales Family XIII bacterium]
MKLKITDRKQRVTHDFRKKKPENNASAHAVGNVDADSRAEGVSGSDSRARENRKDRDHTDNTGRNRTDSAGRNRTDSAGRERKGGVARNENGAENRERNGHAKENRTDSAVGSAKNARSGRGGRGGKPFLRIIPLGGLNEIGKNMTAFEYGDSIMIVDCGMSFPEDEMFGIDVVIPDFGYIEDNFHKVKGLVITHGHEDHIGGVPYLLKRVNIPVYATGLALGLIKSKLDEHGLKAKLKRIEAGHKLTLGDFKVEAIHMTHSIADSLSFAIHTPLGVVYHSGDFKVDYTPVGNFPIDLPRLAELGGKGVLLMLSDSTNANRQGHTKSEKHLNTIMENIFRDATGRIIVATFASNVHRIQTIIDTAVKFRRKVALSGRSMDKIMNLAMEMGYVNMPKDVLVDLQDARKIPDKKLVIVTTGSQGEPMSALTRMAMGEHRQISIREGDRIILSSTPIPGNEKTVSNIVNLLLARGADVTYSEIADIHVSGHACEDELKLLFSLIRPKYFMPVHGEVRHLYRHADIAKEMGIDSKDIFILENGNVLELREGKVEISKERVDAEPVFVDGLGVGDIGTMVLRDRKLLSESGLIVVVAGIDRDKGKIVSGPDILTRGFVYVRDNEALIAELRGVASDKFEGLRRAGTRAHSAIKKEITSELKRYIYKKTGRSPVILPILMDD